MGEKEIRIQAKILILYLLGNIGESVEFTTINDMVLEDGLVNYFDFAEAFADLLEKGQIASIHRDESGEPLYTITDEGRSVLDSYQSEMLSDVRGKALRHAMRLLAFRHGGVRQRAVIEPVADGFSLTCSMEDKEKVLFKTTVFLPTQAYAEQLKANFEDRSDVIFRGVLSLLSGDVNFIFDD